MPYITLNERRNIYKNGLDDLLQFICSYDDLGALNFIITEIILEAVDHLNPSYSDIVSIMGTLECIKQEFYRRFAAPYENKKIEENGDIYPINAEWNIVGYICTKCMSIYITKEEAKKCVISHYPEDTIIPFDEVYVEEVFDR